MTNAKKSERIFITAKTRMVAEERYRNLNSFLNMLTAWYSFCLIAMSVANLAGVMAKDGIEFSATLMSIALFGVSLFLLGGRILQKAEDHRKCYLALKAIYHSDKPEADKMGAYDREIERYPNHETIDYDLMIKEASLRGQNLWNDEGTIVLKDDIKARVKKYGRNIMFLKGLAMLSPIAIFVIAGILAENMSE